MIPDAELIHVLVDFGMCVVLWLVQLVIYPSFLRLKETELLAWHRAYTFRVSFVIMPLMLAQLGFAMSTAYTVPGALTLFVLALVLLCWLLTFFVSVPLHNQLSAGNPDRSVRERLIRSNWPRTALWSAVFLLQFV